MRWHRLSKRSPADTPPAAALRAQAAQHGLQAQGASRRVTLTQSLRLTLPLPLQSNVRNYYQQFLDNHPSAQVAGQHPGMAPGQYPGQYPPRYDASQGMRPLGGPPGHGVMAPPGYRPPYGAPQPWQPQGGPPPGQYRPPFGAPPAGYPPQMQPQGGPHPGMALQGLPPQQPQGVQ